MEEAKGVDTLGGGLVIRVLEGPLKYGNILFLHLIDDNTTAFIFCQFISGKLMICICYTKIKMLEEKNEIKKSIAPLIN